VSSAQFQIEVARVALLAAARHGFVLGGGQALMALGIVDRPTQDVDLFTAVEDAVPVAAAAVRAALEAAGYQVTPLADQPELGGLFEGFDLAYVEWRVGRGAQFTELTLAHLPQGHRPVTLDIGPVMHEEDLLASKVAAAAARAEPRDFIDIAAATSRYSLDALIALGRRYDPGLTEADLVAAGRELDRMTDDWFAPYGLDAVAVAQVRSRLKEWPR
jgi:hypothetical protein